MCCFPGHKEINFGIPQIKRSTRNTQMSGTLQTDYPEVTLEKVTSQPGLPSEKARFVEDWPELTLEDDEKSIHAPYPAWLLTPEGTVKGSNLLAGWLWEEAQPNKLLGSNFSTIFSRNFKRIPKEKNGEFYTKKTSIMKRLEEEFGPEPYHHYINGLKNDPDLWKIYEKGEWLHEHQWETHKEWQYVLRIKPPKGHKPTEHLEFQVTVFRLPENKGFFVIGKPHPDSPLTQTIVKQQYNQAMEAKSMIDYVHYLDGVEKEDDMTMTKERESEIQPDVSDTTEEVKITPEADIDQDIMTNTVWRIMRDWVKEAEELDLKVKQSEARP